MKKSDAILLCPCGGVSLALCCEPFITQRAVPQTAQALMRSRYTAFTLRDDAYLYATWHPSTRPAADGITDADTKWLGLEVRNDSESGN
ncbi:MAG: YchJ family metal-binding protein, partial [Glaciimonas sp.]|nr:YchJ family metal-binding protein [Glaciimonas sp.]